MSRLVALGVFSSYFLLIALLFYIILSNLPRTAEFWLTSKRIAATFVGLAVVSFAHTWFYMFKFMAWSFTEYERSSGVKESDIARVSSWLDNTALFEQAWAAVCSRPVNWWWSEQLCLFTVGAWTIFLSSRGRENRIKHLWAFMLLGQVVAISVASNLFYIALTLAPQQQKRKYVPRQATPSLWISVVLALVTVGLSPFTSERTFLLNLLLMHVLLMVPLLAGPAQSPTKRLQMPITTLYLLAAAISAGLHLRTTYVAIMALPSAGRSASGFSQSVVATLHSHPAQSSIGWDVVWTSVSFVVWTSLAPTEGPRPEIIPTVVAVAVGSVGVVGPYVLSIS